MLTKDDPQVPAELRGPVPQQGPFKLLNSLDEAPAQQPPHFKRHLLRPEQLRSLAWMLAREGFESGAGEDVDLDIRDARGEQEPFVLEWRQLLTDARTSYSVDLRAKASYIVRGGILADRVGFGKTATTIGLIDATKHYPAPSVPRPENGSFIPAKGTLVIVPSNLLDQWAQEISKFVWDGSRLAGVNSGWAPGRTKQGCPLKVLTISTVSPLRLLTAGELAEADVVLVSYRLLFSRIYQERRENLAGGTSLASLMQCTRKLMSGDLMIGSGDKARMASSKTLVFPLLEMFWWRRVVFDEFHELESFQGDKQVILQHMRAHSRWGLTGTPPIDKIAGVIFMSSLFRCDLPGYLPVEKVPIKKGSRTLVEVPHMQYYEEDRLMRETAARFLDRFARQNTAELPHIALQQHTIPVWLTAAERALYLGEVHDTPEVNLQDEFLSPGKMQVVERLLKLCSHFQAGGGASSESAEVECARVGEEKSRRRAQEHRQLASCCRVLQILKGNAGNETWRKELDEMEASLKAQGRPAVDELAAQEVAAAEESTNDRCRQLAGHRPRDPALAAALAACVDGESGVGSLRHWEAFASTPRSSKETQELLAGQVKEQLENLLTFCSAVASHTYFEKVRRAFVEGWDRERRCCACSEEGLPLTRLAITPCAHAFCLACLRRSVEVHEACSFCRQPLKSTEVRPLEDTVEASHGAREWVQAPPAGSRFRKYGTKLAVLVQKLQELRRQDPAAKAILFVQFDDVKLQVAAALKESGMPTAQLRGSVSQRASVIRDWQEMQDSRTFVLLLSLAESASGTNLTAASHVVFLHPMLASTTERAVAQELQAIGRSRRHGQLRDTLHVWRFVTVGTVEQSITERHQGMIK